MKITAVSCIILSFCIVQNETANILTACNYPSQSHHILALTLMKGLLKRGHNITMMSSYAVKERIANFTHLELGALRRHKETTMQEYMQGNVTMLEKLRNIKEFRVMQTMIFQSDAVKFLLNTTHHFDLMIQCPVFESTLALAHLFDVPVVGFAMIGGLPHVNEILGNPAPTSFVPNAISSFTDKMSFFERLWNSLIHMTWLFWRHNFEESNVDATIQEYLPGTPSYRELVKRIDVILVNSHVSTESPRPYLPNMIQIGGFHMQEPDELSRDLKDLMDKSKEGVVYFSFGTNVKSSKLPKEKLKIFTDTFGKLPMKVLWKFEEDHMENKPDNVVLGKWFPQQSILAHLNTKLFVTHGGMGGNTEALYYGIPLICIPFFGDQEKNCADVSKNGYGITLDMSKLTAEEFSSSLRQVLEDPRFVESTKLKSELYRQQPADPMHTAIYWIEHVIKYKGARHLKAAVLDLAWYQYLLLDVFGFIFIIISLFIYIEYLIGRMIFNRIFGRTNKLKIN